MNKIWRVVERNVLSFLLRFSFFRNFALTQESLISTANAHNIALQNLLKTIQSDREFYTKFYAEFLKFRQAQLPASSSVVEQPIVEKTYSKLTPIEQVVHNRQKKIVN